MVWKFSIYVGPGIVGLPYYWAVRSGFRSILYLYRPIKAYNVKMSVYLDSNEVIRTLFMVVNSQKCIYHFIYFGLCVFGSGSGGNLILVSAKEGSSARFFLIFLK